MSNNKFLLVSSNCSSRLLNIDRLRKSFEKKFWKSFLVIFFLWQTRKFMFTCIALLICITCGNGRLINSRRNVRIHCTMQRSLFALQYPILWLLGLIFWKVGSNSQSLFWMLCYEISLSPDVQNSCKILKRNVWWSLV